jgi:hypothetical protein
LVCYKEVVEVDLSRDSIFYALNDWLSQSVTSYKSSVDYVDKDAGIITAKANVSVNSCYSPYLSIGYVSFTIKFEVKSGRYRYILTNFVFEYSTPGVSDPRNIENDSNLGGFLSINKMDRDIWYNVKYQLCKKIPDIVTSIKNSVVNFHSDDW